MEVVRAVYVGQFISQQRHRMEAMFEYGRDRLTQMRHRRKAAKYPEMQKQDQRPARTQQYSVHA